MRNLVFLGTTIFMLSLTAHATQPTQSQQQPPLSNTLSEANNSDQKTDDMDSPMFDNSGRYALNNGDADPLDNNNDATVLQEVDGAYYE